MTRAGRGATAGLRPRQPVVALRGQEPPPTWPWPRPSGTGRPGSTSGWARRRWRSIRPARWSAPPRGAELAYDKLVLATGSYPFVPPIKGNQDARLLRLPHHRGPGGHRRRARPASNVGTVIGGGLLGLEAANALRNLGLETHIVESAARLMPLQVDELGGAILRRRIEGLGVAVHTGMSSKEVVSEDGRVRAAAVRRRRRAARPTWWCSRPASAPATSWAGPAAWRSGPGAGSWSTTAAAPPGPTSTPSASAPPTTGGPTAWWPPATRWPRRRPPTCWARRRGCPAPST